MAIRALSGAELLELYDLPYRNRLFPRLVADTPKEAKRRLSARFGDVPSRSGANNVGIRAIRNAIAKFSSCVEAPNGLIITAPHTHWDTTTPVVISFNGEAYTIGQSRVCDDEVYYPVSFVFSEFGPLAYEWTDRSAAAFPDQIASLWDCVSFLNGNTRFYDWPLGVAINFRFKAPFDDRVVSVAEYQGGDNLDGNSPAVVVRTETFLASHSVLSLEQVGWHAFSERLHRLSPQGMKLAAHLRRVFDQLPSEEEISRVRSVIEQASFGRIHLDHQ